MSDRKTVVLVGPLQRKTAHAYIDAAPQGYSVTIAEPSRTLDQNAVQWPILEDFSRQLKWPVDGEMVHMTPEEWKDVLSAAFKREQVRLARGIDGGLVMLGRGESTSRMSKKRFSEWIEFLKATAALRGVVLREPEVTE